MPAACFNPLLRARARATLFGLCTALPLATLAACSTESRSDGDLAITPLYDQTTGHVVLQLSRPLEGDERLLVRARRGSFGTLDCAATDGSFSDVARTDDTQLVGPAVDATLLQPFYGPEWMHAEPTPEMLASLAGGVDSIIDVCFLDGSRVLAKVEADLFQAWDRGTASDVSGRHLKADAPNGETRITSAQQYGVRCVGELGEIPFFVPTTAGQYTTYNCLDGTVVPMTVTDAAGNVTSPTRAVSQCDKPSYQYGNCEAGARVATRINDQGTRWTLMCRKRIDGAPTPRFNDISMIGYNPFTGKTCFFQNAINVKTDGAAIPHPADTVASVNLWSGVHGGIGSGNQCVNCHDADPFVHTPWIDGARDEQGRPIVPKYGFDQDLPAGDNEEPYALVNAAGQGWTMSRQLVSPEANACTRCHRIGDRQWLAWMKRLDGSDPTFKNFLTTPAYRTFARIHWMPPNLTGLDESTWPTSPVGRALNFIKTCATNRALCQWGPIPTTRPGGDGSRLRNPVTLPDRELAERAADILGVNTPGAESRCGECHALTRGGLTQWRNQTMTALDTCLAEYEPGESRTEQFTNLVVPRNQFTVYGPFSVGLGGRFEARLTGSGDGDLYVKKGAAVSQTVYDCRPNATSSNETCGRAQFDAWGPAQFYVGVLGRATTSTVSLEVTYNATDGLARDALARVSCMRMEPANPESPFSPAKVGYASAAAHRPYFEELFRAAYPADAPGNTPNTWVTEFLRFRQRVTMPKGNHPRLTQEEFDIVMEWPVRGYPFFTDVIPPDPEPPLCTPSITPDLVAHTQDMQTRGWTALNRAAGIAMAGCGTATDPQQCLTTFPEAGSQPYGQGWASLPGAKLRILREMNFRTSYWMRSSADGRWIANGGSPSRITDVQTQREISVQAAYDPGFWPDNSGFMYQGTPIGTGTCRQTLLTSTLSQVTFREAQCSGAAQIALYQHLGKGVNTDADYFTVAGQFTSDSGGHGPTLGDPEADFTAGAGVTLTPMFYSGNQYRPRTGVRLSTPNEGDTILSPSTLLMVSRLAGPQGRQRAFVVRKVNAVRNGDNYTITAPEVGRFCSRGGKPAISFDERFMTWHHYVEPEDAQELGFTGPNDPAFAPYRQRGAANIYVMDLATGVSRRVTMLNPGQYALFPHFRSDGWIYFQVRDSNSGREYSVASDAKLVLD